jgi:hypothetical protein
MKRAVLVALALLCSSGVAAANGRFPAAQQLTIAPADPSFMVIRTTFGLLISKDAGKSWDWMCESAASYADEDPEVGLTQNGNIVISMSSGLETSSTNGCGWKVYGSTTMPDLAVSRVDPHKVVAINENYVGQTDAGGLVFDNIALVSPNDGTSWNPLGVALDPGVRLLTIEIAGASRLYVSAKRPNGAATDGVLFVSDDDGASWQERATFPGEEPYVAGVDPTDADRVYVRTIGTSSQRLLVSTNAGQSFTPAFTTTGSLLGFALSDDGATVYAGVSTEGVYRAARATMQFSLVSSTPATCLTARAGELWACTADSLMISTDQGATFTKKMDFKQIRGPIDCPAGSLGAACVTEWPALRTQLGIPAPADAGTNDGSTSGDGAANGNDGGALVPEDSSRRTSCNCDLSPASTGLGAGVAAALSALALLRRRRRG